MRRHASIAVGAAVVALVAVAACVSLAFASASKPHRAAGQRAGGLVRLSDEVAPAVARTHVDGGLRPVASTRADSDRPITVTVTLRRREQAGFERFLASVTDPKSASYHHYLSQAALTARFGPSRAEYGLVRSWLHAQGLRLVRGSADRLTLTVRGTRAAVEHAFHVAIDDYRLDGREVYANDDDPAVPARLARSIQGVVGLSSTANPRIVAPADQTVFSVPGCNVTVSTLVTGKNPCSEILADSCWEYWSTAAKSIGGSVEVEDEKGFECAADELNLVTAYASG
ncbi:MAG: protease pro-enzyme activation domain-containing protein, partial [Solirubrobacteraceae bacterium]